MASPCMNGSRRMAYMIREKILIKEKIQALATMSKENWKEFTYLHIQDIGNVLEYLLEKIQKLEEKC